MDLGSHKAFDRIGTLGVEEEFFIVDADGRPVSGTDELVYKSEPPEILDGRLDHELFKFVIETQTPTVDSLRAARDAIVDVRSALLEHANQHGFSIAAAGLHPAAKWRELDHAEKPRYRAQLDRIQYPQHRNTTAGLHIHVGVDDADKAVWIANEIRWYLPIVLALSANSPYWNGFDTGLQSARAKIFEGLPNTGVPTAFEDFEAFQRFERTMVETGSINDRGELWYDVRPHSVHGTVEVRTPDGQADPDRAFAFVEYIEALIEDLGARYDDGEPGRDHRRELLDENKWRALRYGHNAELLSKEWDESIPLGELVEREKSRLGVSGIGEIYDEGSGAKKQRQLRSSGGLDAVCESLRIK